MCLRRGPFALRRHRRQRRIAHTSDALDPRRLGGRVHRMRVYAEWAQRLPRFNALLSGVEPFVVAPRVARHADLRLCPGELTPSNISFTGAQTHSPDIEDTHPMSLEHQIITITLVCVGPDAPRVTAERRETVVWRVPPASLIHDQLEWPDVGGCWPVVGARRHPCVWKSGRQEPSKPA
jgi:hypothetical protein